MQAPTAAAAAAAADRPPDRYVVRPAGVLAELLGGVELLGEDELFPRLRELGLITYPAPLILGLLEDLPEVLAAEVLARLPPTDLVLLGQAGRACRAAVVALGVPQEEGGYFIDSEDEEAQKEGSTGEGTEGGPLLLRIECFVGSVERLAWAKARGCRWDRFPCAFAARYGNLDVLRWAWEHRSPWDSIVCCWAARFGHLEVLQWAREHGCPWNEGTCMGSAYGGHLEVLRWAHGHGCPWSESTCSNAAQGGHLRVLQYARAHGCPWDSRTCAHAARHGNLQVLKWAREHGCPWTTVARDAAATMGYFDNLPLST